MSATTKIEWCDATFNPWIGCTKVSPGCANCYAAVSTRARVLRAGGHETWGRGAVRSRTKTWGQPVAWNRKAAESHLRLRVFCASLADWLDPEVPAAWLADLIDLVFRTPHLDWLLLTKRPQLWRARLQAAHDAIATSNPALAALISDWLDGFAPPNIWAGTTVEDQPRADERRLHLQAIPAAVHFVSYEPALEQVAWAGWEFLDWMILGGESGPGARSLQVEWLWESLYWCRGHGVAPFVKQLGAHVFTQNANALDWPESVEFYECGDAGAASARVKLAHKKGGDLAEFPTELQVREFPKSA